MGAPDDKPVKLVRRRLDAAAVATHFDEIAATAQQVEIRTKGALVGYSDATTDSLAEVGRRLIAGDITAAQIRYFERGDWWSDTLMRARDEFRLVRMREGS